MNRDGKAFATVICLVIVLITLSWFMATAERISPFLWLIPIAIVLVTATVPIRYPSTRAAYVKAWQVTLEGLDALLNEASGGRYERKLIKRDVKAYVLNRSGCRCQYPNCPVSNRRILEVHHIDLNPSRSDDPNNLIVICRNHHKRIQDDGVDLQVVRSWALNHATLRAKGKKVAGIRG